MVFITRGNTPGSERKKKGTADCCSSKFKAHPHFVHKNIRLSTHSVIVGVTVFTVIGFSLLFLIFLIMKTKTKSDEENRS